MALTRILITVAISDTVYSLSEQKLGLIIESYDNGNTSKTLINPNGGNVGKIGTKNPVEAITVEGKGRFNYVSVDG